jgi:hypothetical protein
MGATREYLDGLDAALREFVRLRFEEEMSRYQVMERMKLSIQALVASANREIEDPRAVPRVVARPPARNQNVPLVVLASLRNTVTLRGDPSDLGHFHIELQNGQRYLDANLKEMPAVAIAVPAVSQAFLRTSTREAELPLGGPGEIHLDSLKFAPVQMVARSSVDAAYRQALFASPYGVTYYKGFIDSTGAVGVKFEGAAPVVRKAFSRPPSYRKPLSIGCLAVAGASTIASIVTAILAAGAKRDFDDTTLQRPAHDANERYKVYGNTALATGILAAAAGLAGWLLWPNDAKTPPVSVGGMPGEASGLVLGFSW